jgi:formylglycine-generating enzyme required for sulfatase activity
VPVVHVARADAEASARWRKARLPTAKEWLLARGGCGRTPYPWGKRSRPGLANVFDAKGFRRLAPVDGPAEGATPLGVLRMAGNAAEWTGSTWGDAKDQGAAAGESFVTVPGFAAGLVRRTKVTTRRRDLGFRCAASIPAR